MPNHQRVKLRFAERDGLATATAFTAIRFNPNAAYDVNPTLGSTATVGFSEWAAFYNYYRVLAFDYTVDFINNDSTMGATVYALPTNTDPGTTGVVTYLENPLAKYKTISAKGGLDKTSIRGSHTVAQIVGSNAPNFEDNYRSLVTTVPTDLIWLEIGAQSATGAQFASSVYFVITIDMYTDFYDRKILST